MADKPESIRVTVPESYGDAFGQGEERQWTERRIYIGRDVKLEISGLLDQSYDERKAFERLCAILAEHHTAWGLTDEEGNPLPEPWQNPDAFERLADVSYDLFIWCTRVVNTPLAFLTAPEKNS